MRLWGSRIYIVAPQRTDRTIMILHRPSGTGKSHLRRDAIIQWTVRDISSRERSAPRDTAGSSCSVYYSRRCSRTMCSCPLINFRIKVNRCSHLSRAINPGETRVIIYDDAVSPSRKKIRARFTYLRASNRACMCVCVLCNKRAGNIVNLSRSGKYAWFCST